MNHLTLADIAMRTDYQCFGMRVQYHGPVRLPSGAIEHHLTVTDRKPGSRTHNRFVPEADVLTIFAHAAQMEIAR